MKLKETLMSGIISTAIWSAVSVAVILFFIYKQFLVGPILLALGVLQILSLKLFSRHHRSVKADVVFGVIDNGILVVFALVGASFFGVLGAIVGGAVGNAVTDGIAGIFEGHTAKESRKDGRSDNRTPVSAAIGKMAGCFIGAGAVLTIAWTGAAIIGLL